MKIWGHEKQRKILKNMVREDDIPHAIIFSGPEMIGKKAVAEEFVQLINCEDNSACGECDSCKEIIKRNSADFLLIETDKEITIDKIRELQKRLSFTANRKKGFKAAIIDEAHLMNSGAQTCLLKTLEEPKGNTIIILVTEHPNSLLDTILSRSVNLKFSFVGTDKIISGLIEKGIPSQKAETIAKESFFRPGLATKLAEDSDYRKKWNMAKNDLDRMRSTTLGERFDYLKVLADDRKRAEERLKIWSSVLRKEMLEEKDNKKASELKDILEIIEQVIFLISKTNINLKVSLEKVLINL